MAEVVVVGSYVQDLAFEVRTFPAPGESRLGTFRTGPGGKGFNQAVAASRQGVATTFIGAVGDDFFADALTSFVAGEQLTLALDQIAGTYSGAAAVMVNAVGQNQIIVSLGANDLLTPAFIERHRAVIAGAQVVVTQTESNLDATAAALQLGRAGGAITVLNPAPVNEGVTTTLLELADIVTPNETEFSFLLEHLEISTAPVDVCELSDGELATLCAKLPVGKVIITLGERGVFAYDKQSASYFSEPALTVSVVDTTGAGDAFSGGFAAGLVQCGGDIEQAVRRGVVVASLSVTKKGTAPAMPYAKECQQFL